MYIYINKNELNVLEKENCPNDNTEDVVELKHFENYKYKINDDENTIDDEEPTSLDIADIDNSRRDYYENESVNDFNENDIYDFFN